MPTQLSRRQNKANCRRLCENKCVPFIHADFLLQSAAAQRLYHEFAAAAPILDYHNHLSPRDMARDRRYGNLSEIWLEGDHYKWRAMRADGVPEHLITGDAAPYEKFLAWAATVPHTLRNPLYHWTHLELKRYFDVDEPLNQASAPRIWELANARLAQSDMSALGLLKWFDVRALCTTDDPAESLEFHHEIALIKDAPRVLPTFRPDPAMGVNETVAFNAWVEKLARECGRAIDTLEDFLESLEQRHEDFHDAGCRLSDHGFSQMPTAFATRSQAARVFESARWGQNADAEDQTRFAGYLMLFFGRLDARKGWTKQLHLGATRNNSSRQFARLGADSGFDSIGDAPQIAPLTAYFDRLDRENNLPQTLVYNLNPADNYALASLCGDFQDGPRAGKIQMGAGWWFLDQKEGIEWQLNALSNCGLLWNFVGMLTDSRSLMSFPRHEYFRRVLCNLLGDEMEKGLLPGDFELVGTLVKNVCYANARDYLRLGGTSLDFRGA